MTKFDTSKITCGIKTFERPACIVRLLDSIQKYYPGIQCVVADDSEKPSIDHNRWPNLTYIRMPFDSGFSAGRNATLDATCTPYYLCLDDDFVFEDATRLDWMQAILDADKADLVGGQCRELRRGQSYFRQYHGQIKQRGSTLHLRRPAQACTRMLVQGHTLKYFPADITLNFFLARTELLKDIRWDAELKVNAHLEFFLRAMYKMRIVFCPDVHVLHIGDRPSKKYNTLRGRAYWPLALQKHGITDVKYQGRWR